MSDPLHDIGAFERDLVVQAGAGTGKTHALVTLYLHLVTGLGERPEPVAPARILVITFTDKAAGELRDRIRARLTALVERGLDAEPTLADAARRRGRELSSIVVRDALAELTRAPIGTFHAAGQALLRRHAGLAGVDPSFSLLDPVEAEGRAIDAARAAALAALERGDAGTEALLQLVAFGGRDYPGLIERLAQLRSALAEEGRSADGMAAAYAPEALQAELEQARAALTDAVDDLERLIPELRNKSPENARDAVRVARRIHVGTFDDANETVRGLLGKLRGDAVPAVRERVKAALQRYGDALASFDAAPAARAVEALVGDTERRYTEGKRRSAVVDFGDLIRLPRDVLRASPEVAHKEASRFDAVLVDEFQDTNRVQAELVALLTDSVTPQVGGRRFVVGDRKQSIYEFRGADVAVFTNVVRGLLERGAAELVLRRSFRSSPRVLSLCNALFERAFASRAAPDAWALSFAPGRDALVPHHDDAPDARVELLRTHDDDEDKKPSDVLRHREADAIVGHMRRAFATGRRPGQMALLLRRYTHLPTYLSALQRASIPHYVVRGRGFYEAQEVRDLASMLLVVVAPDDRLALVAALRSPLCGLSDDGIASLFAEQQLDGETVRRGPTTLAAEDAARLERFRVRLLELDRFAQHARPSAALRRIVERFDLAAILGATADGVQKVANVEQLLQRAAIVEVERPPLADLPGFARWLGRAVRPQLPVDEAEAQIVDERDDVVRIMTIHQAKGLEFPMVYVADCGAVQKKPAGPIFYDGELGVGVRRPSDREHSAPSRRVCERRTKRQEAESLRLFYVAATRARDRLIFSGEGTGWRSFVDAMEPTLLDVVERQAQEPVTPPPPSVEHAVAIEDLVALRPFTPPEPRSLRVAVTQLAELSRCERRYHLVEELGLDEPRHGRRQDGLDVRSAGTLIHRLLERCTFGLESEASRRELVSLVDALGHELDEPGVPEIVEHALAWLRSDFARGLAERAIRRELSFSLSLPTVSRIAGPPSLRILRGQMDLAIFDADGIGVLDYKHARRGEGERNRFQLEAYAVAARALYPDAPRIRVGLVHLREPEPSPVWIDVEPPDVLATKLGAVADTLAHLQRGPVPRETCAELGCGFVSWCHP